MLLRRVLLHVRQQNWFAVLLDFVIVVVGVFIGVQVANWNDTQKQQTLYHDAYKRVTQEVSNNIKSIRAVQNYYRKRLPAVQRVIETLRTCGANGGSIENIEATFPVVMNYSQILLSVRDIELLLSNNSFLAFQHTELRTRLSELANYTRFYELELASKTAEMKDTSFLNQLASGPLLGSPDDNIKSIKDGAVGSQELIRKHRFKESLDKVCKNEVILRKYFGWEEAVYFQVVVGQMAVEHFERELTYLKAAYSTEK